MPGESNDSNLAVRRIEPARRSQPSVDAQVVPKPLNRGDQLAFVDEFSSGLFEEESTPRATARAALSFVQNLLNGFSIAENAMNPRALDRLFATLRAEPAARGLVKRLWRWAVAVYCDRQQLAADGVYHREAADELRRAVRWAAERCSTLAQLNHDELTAYGEPRDARGIRATCGKIVVTHGVIRSGHPGCEVSLPILLSGASSAEIWLRIEASAGGQPLRCAPGWDSWSGRLALAPIAADAPRGRWQCLMPLSPQSDQAVFDRAECFVPYDAIDLPASRTTVNLDLTVFTTDGDIVWQHAVRTDFPVRTPRGTKLPPLPSPHSVGAWSAVPGSGHCCVVRSIRSDARVRAAGDEIEIDLQIAGLRGAEITLEAREFGESTGQNDGVRIPLVPASDLMRWSGLTISLPRNLAAMANSVSSVSRGRLIEVVVRDGAGRILCGNLFALPSEDTIRSLASLTPAVPTIGFTAGTAIKRPVSDARLTKSSGALPQFERFSVSSTGTGSEREFAFSLSITADEWRSLRGRVVIQVNTPADSAGRIVVLAERSYLLPRNRVANRWQVELRMSQRELRGVLPARTGTAASSFDPQICQATASIVALDQRLLSIARVALSLPYDPAATDGKRHGIRLSGVTPASDGSGGLRVFVEVPAECLDIERGVVLHRSTRTPASPPSFAPLEFSRDDFYGDRFDALLLGVDLAVEPGALSSPGELLFFAASGEILDARSLPDFAPIDFAEIGLASRSAAAALPVVAGGVAVRRAAGAVRGVLDLPIVRRALRSVGFRSGAGVPPSA